MHHGLDRRDEQGGLIDRGNPSVDVEHLRPRHSLRLSVGAHPIHHAYLHLGGEHLATSGVDALADDDKRAIPGDDDLATTRGDAGFQT